LLLSLPVDARGLAEARSALAAWLERSGVTKEDVDDVLIAANEACMNAVEHSGAHHASKIELSATIDETRLVIEVSDRGTWREPVPTGHRGHGLGLMRKLMDAVEIDRDGEGTSVRMERDLAFGVPVERLAKAPSVTVGEVRGVAVAIFEGDVDLAVVDRLGAELEAAVGPAVGSLVVDLTGVSYLDSAGVHLLFKLAHRRRAAGGATRIVVAAGPVRRVLELTGVEATLGLDESVDQAIGRL
jgi:anti-anti-sigma factor